MTKLTEEPFEVSHKYGTFDLRMFLKNHPGGVNTLDKYKDKSVVDGMLKYDHSTAAYHIMHDYKVESNGIEKNDSIEDDRETGNSIIERERINEELRRIENLVDWSKPMLGQLAALEGDYERWVNTPVDRPLRIFANPIMESLTYSPWYLVPLFWIPVICYFLIDQYNTHVANREGTLTHGWFLVNLVIGAFVWTLVEYSIHRWVFHIDPGKSMTMKTMHFLLHGLHHKVPFDNLRLVFPPVPASVIAMFLYNSFVRHCFNYPVLVTTGALIGYLTYDMIHLYIHNGSPADGTYLYEMKRYHANHHFVNVDKGFGISNKLWDHVFQTKIKLRKLGFSLKW